MLNDRQSLILCGLVTGCFFVSGVLEILDNYIIKTVLTILFLVIMINIFITKSKKEEQNDLK
ncbi:hypothetical protein [Mariniflexile sp. AS56]|uniref:hypothetical protein n=1 Tax=Mariniflexile sp. AS56 TaxID=3063957 RepID=UPI00398B6E65